MGTMISGAQFEACSHRVAASSRFETLNALSNTAPIMACRGLHSSKPVPLFTGTFTDATCPSKKRARGFARIGSGRPRTPAPASTFERADLLAARRWWLRHQLGSRWVDDHVLDARELHLAAMLGLNLHAVTKPLRAIGAQ